MPGSKKWIEEVAAVLVEQVGVERAINLVHEMRRVEGANASARVTLERLEEHLLKWPD